MKLPYDKLRKLLIAKKTIRSATRSETEINTSSFAKCDKKEKVETGGQNRLKTSYIDMRKDHVYYKYILGLLTTICREEDSVCDVGSWDTDMLSHLPCKRKITVDKRVPFSSEEVEGIQADYLCWTAEELDVITCFQVLEHIDDNQVEKFARKLLRDAPIAVVSVPYMWPKGSCKWHVQDPVDVEKLVGWFGKAPVFLQKITEKQNSSNDTRIIAVFVRGAESEIDMDYWKKDAENHIASRSK